jgi:hypothetical protein
MGEVVIAHDETDLSLPRLAPHLPAEGAERGKVRLVLHVSRSRIAGDDHRLVHHKRSAALVVAPDALGLRVGGRAAEYAPEHLERCVYPALLVYGGGSVALDTRDEEDNEDALASTAQDRLPARELPGCLRGH